MGNRDSGFAALSTAKKRLVSAKGGKAAHEKGVAHTFDIYEATEASKKGVAAKRKKRALEAAKYLMLCGLTVEQLSKLTIAELLYYGGGQTTKKRVKELLEKVNA